MQYRPPLWLLSLLLLSGLLVPFSAPARASEGAMVELQLSGLRSSRGMVRICLTADKRYFPNCTNDPEARHLTVATTQATHLRFDALPVGRYALSVIHDENGNGKLDTRLGVPREGFGFSNNAKALFGPPSFRSASFAVQGSNVIQAVTVRYIF